VPAKGERRCPQPEPHDFDCHTSCFSMTTPLLLSFAGAISSDRASKALIVGIHWRGNS